MAKRITTQIRDDRGNNTTNNRVCCKCKTLKKLEEYPDDKSNKYGKSYVCRECNKLVQKIKYLKYYSKNREKFLAKSKKHYREDMKTGKRQARSKALHKIKINTNICCVCNKVSNNLVRHHPDYSKPLFVKIVCPSCHMLIHSKLRSKDKKSKTKP
jgi:hypothetical protein